MAYDLIAEKAALDKLRASMRGFLINPTNWRKCQVPAGLKWHKKPFERDWKKSIPKEPGIYAFVVEHADRGLPPHGYIMYFGITGTKAGRTLQTRFGEYLREKLTGKRFKVWEMLTSCENDLYFHYAPISLSPTDLKALERALLDAFMPPINEKDFSADFGRLKRAI